MAKNSFSSEKTPRLVHVRKIVVRERERKCDGEEGVGRGCIVLFPRSSTHNKSSFPALGNEGNRVSPLFKLLHLPPPSTRSIVARWKEGKWARGESRGENGKRRERLDRKARFVSFPSVSGEKELGKESTIVE